MPDYSRDDLEDALRNAAAAGNTDAARKLADALVALGPTENAAPAAEVPPQDQGFFSRLGRHYNEEVSGGVEDMTKGVGDAVADGAGIGKRVLGAGKAAIGAIRYAGSPVEAAWKTLAVDPAEAAATALGASPAVRQGVGSTVDMAQIFAGAGAPKVIRAGAEALEAAPAAARDIRQALTTSKPAPIAPTTGELGAAPANQLMTAAPATDVAEQKMYDAMIQAGWTPDRIQAKLKQLGPGATLGDVYPFWGMQDVAAQTPAGGLRAARVLGAREAQKQSTLLKAVDSHVADSNLYDTIDDLQKARSVEGKAARDAAMDKTGVIKSDTVQRQLETPEGQAGLRKGASIAKLEWAETGKQIPKSETWYHGNDFDDPDLKIVATPTLRMLDAMKQGYDSMLQPFRNKFTGALENLGPYEVQIDKNRRALVQDMRDQSKSYGEYLDTWGDYSKNIDAVNAGRRALSQDPEVVKKALARMTPADKEYFQIGLARDLKDSITQNPNAALKAFQNRDTRNILQQAMGDKSAYNRLRQSALREAAKARTFRSATGNSRTAARALGAMEAEVPAKPLADDVVGGAFDIATGNKVGVARRIVNRVRGASPKPDTVTPILDQQSMALHNQDPVVQARILARLRQKAGVTGTSGLLPQPE